jgi:hypothetical protein
LFVAKLSLPHSSTIRKWLSSVTCEVGFLSEVFEFLKTQSHNDYLKDVALIFDSMAIRKQIVYDKQSDKHYGYVDLGGIANIETEEMATEALVLQIVSFTKKFKCPVAYFFVNKITSSLQKQFLLLAIEKLFNIGIIVRSITCDGCITNLKTIQILGCNLSPDNMCAKFEHPQNKSNIFCILDPCHVLKLLRNAFGEITLSSLNGQILFSFIDKLNQLQEREDLKLANAISNAHVNFKQKKMNVGLAAQTISSGVADAIDFLRKSGHPDFIGSEATTEFIRIFDRIFDIMNSRSPYQRGYKRPLYLNNMDYCLNIFAETEKYIKTLKVNDISILQHNRKTFALGFLMNIYSFQNLAVEFLTRVENPLRYFLTYKCSQDHLELFFSCIRARGGWNDNPNCLQFRWALRKLLFRNTVQPSVNANCTNNDQDSIPIFELGVSKDFQHSESHIDNDITGFVDVIDNLVLSPIKENILYYISGYILKKMLVKNSCCHCHSLVMTSKETISGEHSYSLLDINDYKNFTKFVSNGKLYFPSRAVFEIVKYTEKAFRAEVILGHMQKPLFKKRIMNLVQQQFIPEIKTLFYPSHPVVDISEDLHEIQIIKFVSSTYANVRIQTHAKKKNLTNIRRQG